MSGNVRKRLPRAASDAPTVLRDQLVEALGVVAAGRAAELHELIDGAVHQLVAAALRGDSAGVEALAGAVRAAADEVPSLGIPAAEAARYRLAVLPRVADVVARLAPGAEVGVALRAPAGAAAREILAVLAEEADGDRGFLRAGEVHARGDFDVSDRRVGQLLDQLLDAGWLVQVVRNTPGPARHYALSPVGAKQVAALGIVRARSEPARSSLFERFERLPYMSPASVERGHERPRRARLPTGASTARGHGAGMPA